MSSQVLHKLALIVGLGFTSASLASNVDVVRCEGSGMTVNLRNRTQQVYEIEVAFAGGTVLKFQANGVARSRRGFATWGTRGLVYYPSDDGSLKGWLTLDPESQFEDLTCEYLSLQ